MKKAVSWTLALTLCTGAVNIPVKAQDTEATATISYKYGDVAYERQMEKLDRGMIAVKTDNGVYIGWRLLGDECSVSNILSSPDFDVYRNGEKIATVTDSTNFLDTSGTITDSYNVAVEGEEPCAAVAVGESYFDIPMNIPKDFVLNEETSYAYSIGDTSCGDIDGDGQYELVVKWDCNAQDNSNSGITGNVLLDAYELDGTFLWRIDLGRNIRSGAHYTQFLVYDFNLDGIAEITAKTAPGSIDGKGNYVTEASSVATIRKADNTAVYVNDGGYIVEGDEYFTVFDGRTGGAIDTIYYPNQRISPNVWGDTYGNRCDRFLADVAYLDGETPYAVYWRGYYGAQGSNGTRMAVCAIKLDKDGNLQCDYCFDSYDTSKTSGYLGVHGYTSGNELYNAQGNHNMTVADVDNDGKDEFISGSLCFEVNDSDKLMPKWCSFRGHGDALHIGDYDPTHYGLEYFSVHEGGGYIETVSGKQLDYGMTVYDASTGEELFHQSGNKDTGRGMMANVGAGGYYQLTSARTSEYIAKGNEEFSTASVGMSMNFRIFWDADIYDELLDGTSVTSWNGSSMSTIFTAKNCIRVNGTKANPALQADLFGDWREELCYPLSDNTALRVFTTTDVTTYKLPTLMHDPVYRSGVAAEQTAYNQPPHIGFYLSDEIYRAALVGIDVVLPDKTNYVVGESLDLSGLAVTGNYEDGENYDITGYSVTGFDTMSSGEQTITVSYMGFEQTFKVYVSTPFKCNDSGYITAYSGTSDNAVIPEKINGIKIIGIAEGVFDNTTIKDLYVYDNVVDINSNSFGGITVYCCEGSKMHIYAIDNNVNYQLISRENYDYIINCSFEETEFDGLGLYQNESSQEASIGSIKFAVGGRKRGGDNTSGFSTATDENNKYLRCGIGQFATNGRNGYIAFSDVPALSTDTDNVIAFKFMIPYTISKNTASTVPAEGYFTLEDSSGVVDTVSIDNLAIEYDTWYGYMLIYHEGKYYRVLSDDAGNLMTIDMIGTTSSDVGISKMNFLQSEKSISNNAFGKGSYTTVGIDDLKIYTAQTALANVYINVKDKNSEPIEDAVVSAAGFSKKTDADGYAEFLLPIGIYTVNINAEGYIEKEMSISVYKEEVTDEAVMEIKTVPAVGVELSKTETATAIGKSRKIIASAIPSNATDDNFVWSSDDESVVTVDNGIITGVSEGSANVSVTLGEYSAVCVVNVYDTTKYTQNATTIEIEGGTDTAYIPTAGTNSTVGFSAVVYDQNSVEIENAKVSWFGDGVSVSNGILKITPNTSPGKATVIAKSSNITASIEIELVSILEGAEIYADTDGSDAAGMTLRQGSELVTSTIGDITYGVNPRGDGGDGTTGFSITNSDGDYKNTVQIGRFGGSSRNPYMALNTVPAEYESNKDYVFETDVYFTKGSTMSITLSNNVIVSTALTEGIESDAWFKYKLIYSDGVYTQYVFDENNKLISVSTPVSSLAVPISKINFIGEDGDNVIIDNTKYYSINNAVTLLNVKTVDIDGAIIAGANVKVGAVHAITDSRGRAVFGLPLGVYEIPVSNDGSKWLGTNVVLSEENRTLTIVYDESLIPEVTPEPTATPAPKEPYYITAVNSANGLEVTAKAYSTPDRNAKSLYTAFYKDGRLLSVSIYTKNRPLISSVFDVPEEADSYVCTAWNSDDEPIAISVSGIIN